MTRCPLRTAVGLPVTAALLIGLITAGTVDAGNLDGRWGVGLETGLTKLIGGGHDFSNVDNSVVIGGGYGLSTRWNLYGACRYANARPGVDAPDQSAGWTTTAKAPYQTVLLNPRLTARYRLAPASRWSPWVGAGLGWLRWRVIDMRTAGDKLLPDGTTAVGYDNGGNQRSLRADNATVELELGLDVFVSDAVAICCGGRYQAIVGNDLDSIGLSAAWGPGAVDANNGAVEGVVGLALWFGVKDRDGDGILNERDVCPGEREDFDGYEDQDGCPDPDNDRDGIPDERDRCPDRPEDADGFIDEDGCPDPDNDSDGIPDDLDLCPDQPEDYDGFADEDGCRDPDNDGDGIPDARDECPDTARHVAVGDDGCPDVAPVADHLVLEGVAFGSASAALTADSQAALARLAESLRAYPDARIEVCGHTDNTGSAEANRALSHRRALAVRQALIRQGVAPDRVSAIGYGADRPLASNATEAGRAANRRVEIVRTDR